MRALLSVDDKTGLIALARGLQELGWELVATDGTRAALAAEGVTARSIEDLTGSPTLLDGRVKTLHPKIHAAILARRANEKHMDELRAQSIQPIDLVASNLYPFREAAASGATGDALLEKIDIGGVTLLRAAAKNHSDVIILSRPERYGPVLEELRERGSVSVETRRQLAAEAFSHNAAYDAAIAAQVETDAGVQFPVDMTLSLRKVLDLRYGVHPQRQATFYEAMIAPAYAEDALPVLKERKNLEIFAVRGWAPQLRGRRGDGTLDYKRVSGGILVQTPDESVADESNFKVVTERHPTLEELTDLIFAWRCVRHVTSNGIVLAKNLMSVGIGPGQLSRVVAVEVAVRKAGENARLAVMSSDAYFPFPDGIEVAARAGVTAIIQPGGSMRDQMMIDTANRHRMAMLFTGRRHFKH